MELPADTNGVRLGWDSTGDRSQSRSSRGFKRYWPRLAGVPLDIIWHSGTAIDHIWYGSDNNSFEEKVMIDEMDGGYNPI